MNWFELTYVALVGLAIGSFLNAVVYRLPRKIPFGLSRSVCPTCKKQIRALDNIPLVSYMILRGRCRDCKSKISFRYPAVEALNAAVYIWLYFHYGLSVELAMAAIFSSALLAIIFIDLEHMIIPDVITLPGIGLALGYSLTSAGMGMLPSLLGAVVGGGSLYAIALLGDWLFKKESMGGGDIKMAAALGALLGWKNVLLVFFVSALIGLLVSIVVMVFSAKFRRERMLPFGPFLALAGFFAMIYGERTIKLYSDYLAGR
ncbi:MAG: prepilin peptidase [candidate division Zixibacteria bacterium]|nr:prepilin peptidase [candidate division Zixibacteria bacterium]